MPVFIIMITLLILYAFQGISYKLLWKKGLDARLDFSEKQVFYGETAHLKEIITNKKLLPLPWIWVKFQTDRSLLFTDTQKGTKSDNYYRNDLFFLLGYQKISRTLEFACTQRGYFTIKQLIILGSGILFQEKESLSFECDTALTVYPRIFNDIALDDINTRIIGDISARGFMNPDPFEFAGIREYTYGDSFRDINFNASSRMGQLMANIHTPSVTKEISIILFFKNIEIRDLEKLLENSISLAATLAKKYITAEFNVELITNCYDCVEDSLCKTKLTGGSISLMKIYEGLARIDLKKPFSEIDIKTASKNIIFISPFYNNEIYNVFKDLSARHYSKWILPVIDNLNVSDPFIEVWRESK